MHVCARVKVSPLSSLSSHACGLNLQTQFVEREQSVLLRLHERLVGAGATEADLTVLRNTLEQLHGIFLVCVAGEFNAGKSTMLNALLGKRYLPEGVTPTTSDIWKIGWRGPPVADEAAAAAAVYNVGKAPMRTLALDVPWLRHLELVDTPGVNAVIQDHSLLTTRFLPRADIVMFVTSVDRPLSESECNFMKSIVAWNKVVVLIVNKRDALRCVEDEDKIMAFVREHARTTLGYAPRTFLVSAYAALEAKLAGAATPEGAKLWASSGFAELEDYVVKTLAGPARVDLKLEAPLGVGAHLSERYLEVLRARRAPLAEDCDALERLDREIVEFSEDMLRHTFVSTARVRGMFADVRGRSDAFLDSRVRFANVAEFFKPEAVVRNFVDVVIGDLDARLNDVVNDGERGRMRSAGGGGSVSSWRPAARMQRWRG